MSVMNNNTIRTFAVVAHGAPLREVARPSRPLEGTEVMVKTTYAGLCHSDLHQIDGYFSLGGDDRLDLTVVKTLPFCVGHEIEGIVIAFGPDAKAETSVKMGDSCAVYPWCGCRKVNMCGECAEGSEHLCTNFLDKRDIGNGMDMEGGFSSHVVVPHPSYLFPTAGLNMSPGLAGTYMCSGLTAYSALKKLGTPPNGAGDILIIGLGGVGMQGFHMARALFGDYPLATDIRQEALDEVARLGGKCFNATEPKVHKSIKKATANFAGVYGVVDFVGNEKSFALANRVVRRGGQIVVVGLLGGKIDMPLAMLTLKSTSIRGTLVGSLDECKEMFALIREGKIGEIPHETRSVRHINAAIQDLRDGRVVGRCLLKHDWEEWDAPRNASL